MFHNTTTNLTVLVKCDYEHFCGFFSAFYTKITFISFCNVLNIINILIFYGIVWYERFGTDNRRTSLKNKIISLLCSNAIFSMSVNFFVDFSTYFLGPLNQHLCFFFQLFRNIIALNTLLFLNALIVTKYVLIFCLKNPAAVRDDFWHLFIGLTTVILSTVNKFSSLSLPQKYSLYYYACADLDPMMDQHLKKANNMQIEVLASLIIHLVINLRIKAYKTKHKIIVVPSYSTSPKAMVLDKTESQSLSDSASNFCIAIWGTFYIFLQRKVNGFTLDEANSYPNYLFMFAYHFVAPSTTHFLIASLYYIRHAPLRNTILKKIRDFVKNTFFKNVKFPIKNTQFSKQ